VSWILSSLLAKSQEQRLIGRDIVQQPVLEAWVSQAGTQIAWINAGGSKKLLYVLWAPTQENKKSRYQIIAVSVH
jgi:hypothetical protein